MGKIAEALKANLQKVAQSDARSLRQIDQELAKASSLASQNSISGSPRLNQLLGKGSFEKQTIKTLKGLCKENGIGPYSKLNKSGLCKLLNANGIVAPPPPLESLTKKELINIIKSLAS